MWHHYIETLGIFTLVSSYLQCRVTFLFSMDNGVTLHPRNHCTCNDLTVCSHTIICIISIVDSCTIYNAWKWKKKPKVVYKQLRGHLGTSRIYSPFSPPSLIYVGYTFLAYSTLILSCTNIQTYIRWSVSLRKKCVFRVRNAPISGQNHHILIIFGAFDGERLRWKKCVFRVRSAPMSGQNRHILIIFWRIWWREVRLSETSLRQKKSDDSAWDCPIFLIKTVINSSVFDDFGGDAFSTTGARETHHFSK